MCTRLFIGIFDPLRTKSNGLIITPTESYMGMVNTLQIYWSNSKVCVLYDNCMSTICINVSRSRLIMICKSNLRTKFELYFTYHSLSLQHNAINQNYYVHILFMFVFKFNILIMSEQICCVMIQANLYEYC